MDYNFNILMALMYCKNIVLLQTVAPTITTSTTTPGTVTTAPTTTSAPTAVQTTVQTAQTSTSVYFISITITFINKV